jgi:hypothetical protein
MKHAHDVRHRDEIDVNDLDNWTPEGVSSSFAFYSAIPGENISPRFTRRESGYVHLLLMCPEHANICGKAVDEKWRPAVRVPAVPYQRETASEQMPQCARCRTAPSSSGS